MTGVQTCALPISLLGFSGVIAASLVSGGGNPFYAVLAGIVAGLLFGVINGLLVAYTKIVPFIVTLGMLNIARGAALQISGSRTIFDFPACFNRFGTMTFFNVIPSIFIIAFVLMLVGHIILRYTVFGRMIYAIGNNEEAVRLSGHNTGAYKILAFVFCGLTVGVAAIMYMLRLNIVSPILGAL